MENMDKSKMYISFSKESIMAYVDDEWKQFLRSDVIQELQVKTCNKPAVIGSLPDDYWEQRCKLIEKVEEENPCDSDITSGQIEAWNNYHKFIKERGQRQ